MEVNTNQLKIVITKHAIQRIMERGCSPDEVLSFLLKSNVVVLLKNHMRGRGYEILMPFKGWLVGDLDHDVFIVKTFKTPIRFRQESYVNGTAGCSVVISSVSIGKHILW